MPPTPADSLSADNLSLPANRISPGLPHGPAFFAQLAEVLDVQPAIEAAPEDWDGLLEKMAVELYRIGSMLLGDGEETVGLIEKAVATADVPSCSGDDEARHSGLIALAAGAVALLNQRNPGSLAAPGADSGPAGCIEDDDLSAAGLTPGELRQMLTGPDSGRLRQWLESLTPALHVIFVLRAVAGLSSVDVAVLLAEHGGQTAQDWTPDAVRSSFRQALCSLASQLLHASAQR